MIRIIIPKKRLTHNKILCIGLYFMIIISSLLQQTWLISLPFYASLIKVYQIIRLILYRIVNHNVWNTLLSCNIDDINSDNYTKPNPDMNLNELVLKMNNDLRIYEVRNHAKLYITSNKGYLSLQCKISHF